MVAPLLLLLALQAQDPVRVGARLIEEEIHAGETTILRVDVETEGARAQIQRFRTLPPGIEVTGTRDYDQRQFSLPGGTRRFITREFVLRARAAGRYRIPSIEVLVDGRVYTTSSMLLTVTSAPTQPRGETRSAGDEGVILRAWLDADTVFVGEQVTLEVEAMFSQEARMRLRRAPEYEAPSPSGFWVHELPDPGRAVNRTMAGEAYEVQRFRRAFFPLSPGDYTIPPARLEYEMRRGLLYAPETRELTSDPLALTVLAIPPDAPPAFTGAVGRYTLRGRVEPATVPVGEATVLTVVVEGTGNIKALPPPALPSIEGVDAFPPSEEAETSQAGSTVQGRKTFSWVLIPRQAGDVEIPAIRYAFFDPDAGAFETAAVPPLALRATPAAGSDEAPAPSTIRFLKTAPEGDPLSWVRSSWFAALQALPLLLLAGALLWRRRQRRKGRVTAGGLRRELRETLRELERRGENPGDRELFGDAGSFARRWLARRLGLAPGAVAEPRALARAGVPEEAALAVRAALDGLASARYAPTAPEPAERRALMAELRRVLEAVDRAAPARPADGAESGGAPAWLLLAAVAIGAAPAAGQAANPGTDPAADLFGEGLSAFANVDYEAAADAFDRYVRQSPRDAAGWYNLGTAYHRSGQPGYGVWAWLRALQIDPRDDDTRHNLRVAGTRPELVQRVAPPVPLRTAEMLLLAALAWLVAGITGSLWLLRRNRSAAAAALIALAVALTAIGMWWTAARGGDTLIVLDAAVLRAGPALQSEVVSTLEPGTGLVPVDTYGDWARVRTLRGEEGWIESGRTGRL